MNGRLERARISEIWLLTFIVICWSRKKHKKARGTSANSMLHGLGKSLNLSELLLPIS